MPLLFGTDRKKLSKRHGATKLEELTGMGFLPEVVRNYLCFLSTEFDESMITWTLTELVDGFDVEALGTSASIFDPEKLRWMNGRFIRSLDVDEFGERVGQICYVSATPADYELELAGDAVVEQVIRPTGLMDPVVEVRPAREQVDDLLEEIRARTDRGDRVLVTTLTKRMAEELTEYYGELGVRVRYMHSDIETLERVEILRELRAGTFDVLIGINLLREGLDLPEVSLVAILDADKEGFLRSARSLIQTMGRAARNVDGTVLLYADKVTRAMDEAITVTRERRRKQEAYNTEHGITPQTIRKAVGEVGPGAATADYAPVSRRPDADALAEDPEALIESIREEMLVAAAALEFERAAELRDRLAEVAADYGVQPLPARGKRRGGRKRRRR